MKTGNIFREILAN